MVLTPNQTEFPNIYIYSENSWVAASGNLACMLTTQLSPLYYLLLYDVNLYYNIEIVRSKISVLYIGEVFCKDK